MRKQTIYLSALALLSIMAATYEAFFFCRGADVSENLVFLSQLIAVVLLVLWMEADSKNHPEVYRSYEFGQLVFLFWLPYLPFYLWRTRRAMGMLMLFGILVLFFLSDLARWAIYLTR